MISIRPPAPTEDDEFGFSLEDVLRRLYQPTQSIQAPASRLAGLRPSRESLIQGALENKRRMDNPIQQPTAQPMQPGATPPDMSEILKKILGGIASGGNRPAPRTFGRSLGSGQTTI